MRVMRPVSLAILTVVMTGLPAAAALTGSLTLGLARPEEAKGVVTADMSQVKAGIDKRDADGLDPRFRDVAANPANKFVTFEARGVEIAGPLEPGKDVPVGMRGAFTAGQKPINHGMQVPRLLIFRVSNEIQIETDLTFARQ